MIDGSTRLAAVIGDPVRHSRSPAIHNAAFAAAGLDWAYAAFEVPPGGAGAAVQAMRALGLGGLSVTMPHKAAVIGALDALDADAAALGAVNCIAWDGGRLVGHNTDGAGFVDALRADLGLDPAGLRVAVIGAGGAARAVVRALTVAGAGLVSVVNRRPERAEEAAALGRGAAVAAGLEAVPDADLVVNATPVGMGGDDRLAVDRTLLHAGQVVVDLVYDPPVTPLLRAAEAAGARVSNGIGMLVHQAAHAFTWWTGVEAPLDAMRAAVADISP